MDLLTKPQLYSAELDTFHPRVICKDGEVVARAIDFVLCVPADPAIVNQLDPCYAAFFEECDSPVKVIRAEYKAEIVGTFCGQSIGGDGDRATLRLTELVPEGAGRAAHLKVILSVQFTPDRGALAWELWTKIPAEIRYKPFQPELDLEGGEK